MEDEPDYTSEEETAELLADKTLTKELLEVLADTDKSAYIGSEEMRLLPEARWSGKESGN